MLVRWVLGLMMVVAVGFWCWRWCVEGEEELGEWEEVRGFI